MNEKVTWKAFGIVIGILISLAGIILGSISVKADRQSDMIMHNITTINNVYSDISQIKTDISWIKKSLVK